MVDQVHCINYRNWNRTRNCGDAITPLIAELATRLPLKSGPWNSPHLLGVGSILGLANAYSHVWGSGYLNPTVVHPGVKDSTYHAVRGQKTCDLLRKLGVPLPEIPLGDPGVLVRRLPTLSHLGSTTKYRAAIVPHHDSVDEEFYHNIVGRDDICLVDILDDSIKPIEQIAESEVVISQSLHGLVFAESFGRPSAWISTRHDPIWTFKFDDWYSTTEEPQETPYPLSNVDDLIKLARVAGSKIDQNALIDSFPIAETISASNPFIDFRSCRNHSPLFTTLNSTTGGRRIPVVDLDDNFLKQLSGTVMSHVYHVFRHHSERSYCALIPIDERVIPSYQSLSEACRYLDRHSAYDYAFVCSGSECRGDEVLESGLSIKRSSVPIAGGVIVVRPDTNQLTRNFVTLLSEN